MIANSVKRWPVPLQTTPADPVEHVMAVYRHQTEQIDLAVAMIRRLPAQERARIRRLI